MKRQLIVMTLMVIPLLIYACNGNKPSETPDIDATVEARVEQKSTETAIEEAQTTLVVQQTAIAATQTALAASSLPIQIVAATPEATPEVSCPFFIYADWGSDLNHYVPEGWMGDISDIKFDDNYRLDSKRPNVIQITYTPGGSNQWAGIYWWDPPGGNFGEKDGGFDLSCATKLTFWARGEIGGEKGEFKVGGIKDTYQDSLQPAFSTGPITLTNEWVQYTLDLTGKDLRHIIGGFVWVTNKPSNPNGATIYLDDIMFE
jgi:hypothetical protein